MSVSALPMRRRISRVRSRFARSLLALTLYTSPPRPLEQDLRAEDVGPQEHRGVLDAAVDVALRREVNDRIDARLEEPEHGFAVGDVAVHEAVARRRPHRLQVGEVPRVGEHVERRYFDARMVGDLVANEVRADEPGAARHQELHETVIPN